MYNILFKICITKLCGNYSVPVSNTIAWYKRNKKKTKQKNALLFVYADDGR